MTKVKICGLRHVEHAQTAVDAGADFIGFVFVPRVRRQVFEWQACSIIESIVTLHKDVPKKVGLFADQTLSEVNRITETCDLDMVQLCGSEPVDYCNQMVVPVIKVLHVDDTLPRDQIVAIIGESIKVYSNAGVICLLDRQREGSYGGTGESFNLEIAKDLSPYQSFILAGGLTPETVGDAIASVRPWAVDVSTGVETRGVKDPGKIEAFIQEVHASVTREEI